MRVRVSICVRIGSAVEAAFIKMHRDGVIFRKKRLINWSCQLQSAISDIEVDKEPVTGRTMLKVHTLFACFDLAFRSLAQCTGPGFLGSWLRPTGRSWSLGLVCVQGRWH
jgi:hypothetical protein